MWEKCRVYMGKLVLWIGGSGIGEVEEWVMYRKSVDKIREN
jgi:hypothetical protein